MILIPLKHSFQHFSPPLFEYIPSSTSQAFFPAFLSALLTSISDRLFDHIPDDTYGRGSVGAAAPGPMELRA
jgi:hypothetical protein